MCKYAQSVPLHGEPSLSCCVISSVYLQHLHSWCLQRSRHTKGGEHWCFLQASDEQPVETPCEVTTWIPSEGSSSSRGMERPLNLKSRKQPGGQDETERTKRGYNGQGRSKTQVLGQKPVMGVHLDRGQGVKSSTQHGLTHTNRLSDIPADQHTPTLWCLQTAKQPEANLSAWVASLQDIFSVG